MIESHINRLIKGGASKGVPAIAGTFSLFHYRDQAGDAFTRSTI
jgi:hypothetical protein